MLIGTIGARGYGSCLIRPREIGACGSELGRTELWIGACDRNCGSELWISAVVDRCLWSDLWSELWIGAADRSYGSMLLWIDACDRSCGSMLVIGAVDRCLWPRWCGLVLVTERERDEYREIDWEGESGYGEIEEREQEIRKYGRERESARIKMGKMG